jgi:hypothetical protein
MRKRTTILLTAGCAIAMVAYLGQALGRPGPPDQLVNAVPSEEQLIDRFLGALERKDADALRRLRVTELEYTQILMPGGVPEGRPLKPSPSKALADLAW